MTVCGANGRLGCANHIERGTCDNPRTILRGVILGRVLRGLKERLLAPELVEEFARAYVAEVNAANRDRSARQASHQAQINRLDRQIRHLLELIKDGHGSKAMAAELREIEHKRDTLQQEIAASSQPEQLPTLHPNLPALYRRKVEALEAALSDDATSLAATAALRSVVDAVEVHPSAARGEVTLTLRGDIAAFMRMESALGGGGSGAAVMPALVAGAGNNREFTLPMVDC